MRRELRFSWLVLTKVARPWCVVRGVYRPLRLLWLSLHIFCDRDIIKKELSSAAEAILGVQRGVEEVCF